jgi:hypothetical protein
MTLDISSRWQKEKKEIRSADSAFGTANYKLQMEALKLARKLSVPRSEYTKDLPQTNTEVVCNANNLFKSQVGLEINDSGSRILFYEGECKKGTKDE